jgi:hypothetical protein
MDRLKIINMAENSKFVSRKGILSCTVAEFFGFITDIRNFKQFIPEGNIKNWHATSDSCSFGVPPLSTVTVRISEKIPFSLVSFSGDALRKNDFNLIVGIINNENKLAEISLILAVDLNPVLKMMASGPIEKFLETLISEMEKFDRWNETFKESQPL